MIINIQIDYNPESNMSRIVKTEIEGVKPSKKVIESNEPQLLLDTNKYTLNPAAVALMKVAPDVRIDIKYQMISGIEYPVIGTEEAFGSGGGNKLTKSLTVSYRGKANERLSKFGDTFTVTPLKDVDGLYVLIGNKEEQSMPDEISIKEDMTDNEDLTDSEDDPIEFEDTSFEQDSTPIDESALIFD